MYIYHCNTNSCIAILAICLESKKNRIYKLKNQFLLPKREPRIHVYTSIKNNYLEAKIIAHLYDLSRLVIILQTI